MHFSVQRKDLMPKRCCVLSCATFFILWARGTGIRGLTSSPQGSQELLVVKDRVGRPPGEIGVSKSREYDNFPSAL